MQFCGASEMHLMLSEAVEDILNERSLEMSAAQRNRGLSSWKYSSALEKVELGVDCMNKSFAKRFVTDINTVLDNVLRDVHVICDDRKPTSLTSITRHQRFEMFLPESVLQ